MLRNEYVYALVNLVHVSKHIPDGIPEVRDIESCKINPLKDDTENKFEPPKGISGTRAIVMLGLNDWKDSKEGT